MLAIRMQRTGRKKHSTYRVVVQDSRVTPTSGKNVAMLGNYDPHTKTSSIEKDKVKFYLDNGAQPSPRAALLFKKEGIKLPKWVSIDNKKKKSIRNTEKLRKNRTEEIAEKPAEEAKSEEPAAVEAPEVQEVEATDNKIDTSEKADEESAETKTEATESKSVE